MYSKLPILAAILSVIFMSLGLTAPNGALTGVSTGTSATTATTGTTGTTGTYTVSENGYSLNIDNLDEKKSTSSYGDFSGTWTTHTGVHIAGIKYVSNTVSGTVSTTDSTVTSATLNTWIMVDPGTELGPPSGVTMSSKTSPGGTVYGFELGSSGASVDAQTSSSGVISGSDLTYWIYSDITYHHSGGGGDTSGGSVWTHYKFHLHKLDCGDASVTDRRTFGQPNTGGEIPADANAPLRYVKYGAWDFKGGDFIGNMPQSGSDRSGTARLDLFPSDGSTYTSYALAALSMYDMGKPSTSGCSGAIDTGVYIPSSLGSATESTINYDNQFTFTPDTGYASHQTLTDGNSNDYLIFKIPSGSLAGLAVAIVNESSAISGGTVCWHYFASSEYKSEQTSFPGNDSEPRVWVIVAYT